MTTNELVEWLRQHAMMFHGVTPSRKHLLAAARCLAALEAEVEAWRNREDIPCHELCDGYRPDACESRPCNCSAASSAGSSVHGGESPSAPSLPSSGASGATGSSDPTTAATIADLSAKLARAVEVVKKCERAGDQLAPVCPVCRANPWEMSPHDPDCKLAAVIRENS